MAAKKVPAPFVPSVRSSADTKNFSSEFTMMDVTYSPAVAPVNGEKLFKVSLTAYTIPKLVQEMVNQCRDKIVPRRCSNEFSLC